MLCDCQANEFFLIVHLILNNRLGVVLKKLDLREEALEVMLEAVKKEPLHWGSWLELSSLCTDKEMV